MEFDIMVFFDLAIFELLSFGQLCYFSHIEEYSEELSIHSWKPLVVLPGFLYSSKSGLGVPPGPPGP